MKILNKTALALLVPIRIIYKIYYLTGFAATLVALYPLFYFFLSCRERYPSAFQLMRIWGFILQGIALVPLKVERSGKLPDGPFIICPNHSSFLDIPALYVLFSRYFVFTGKKEIEKWPLFNIFYTKGMNIIVDRSSRTGAYRAFKHMEEELKRNNPLVIFPEGTISLNAPALGTFKEGAFSLAIRTGVPIIPVTFINNWKRLQRKKFFGKAGPGICYVIIHEPVHTTGLNAKDVNMLKEKVRDIINEPLLSHYKNTQPNSASL